MDVSVDKGFIADALHCIGNGVMITDDNGTILYVNQAFSDITGYSFDEAVGQKPSILQSGRQGPVFYQQMWQQLLKHGSWQGNLWNKRKNGEIYHERLQINQVQQGRHEGVIYVGVFSDLTEEDALAAKLSRAQKNEAIASLVTGVAHNFNNHLTAIVGKAFIGKRAETLEKVKPLLQDISAIAKQASELIQQLMIFSRDSEDNNQYFDLASVCSSTMNSARLAIPSEIEIITEIDPTPLPIYANQPQVEQIIFNLVNNAIDAVYGSESPQIKIALRSSDRRNQCQHCSFKDECPVCAEQVATLTVSDNGRGIPEHIRERIFDPFFSTKPAASGTGLGLSTAFKIVEQLGGTIFVKSEVDAGSTFTICLPVRNNMLQPARQKSVVQPDAPVIHAKGETILVVEDEAVVLATIKSMISELGYHVESAANGMEAIEMFSKYRDAIKLMITDVCMPIVNGDIAVREIRKIMPELPVIFMSGYYDIEIQNKPGPAYTASITKPFNPEWLSKKIAMAIGSGESR